MKDQISYFTKELLLWHRSNPRDLPWKETNDPYVIWLSEIILQQTRVDQGTPYFLKFVKAFPTIADLANADLDQVMRLWEGLGYYSRARNMHFTAKYIYHELAGIFPTTYETIIKLKGVGPYTAAAILSFAYDKVYPVVDGNVIRVLSRYFGVTDYVDDTAVLRHIKTLADSCISQDYPAEYNQAIMNFGALVCTPKAVDCTDCSFQSHCVAFRYNKVKTIPSKSKKIKKRNRFFHFFIISNKESILLEKRIQKDIWQELYQFPMLEASDNKILKKEEIHSFLKSLEIIEYKLNFKFDNWSKQTLTHQNIKAKFYHIYVKEALKQKMHPYYLVKTKNLENFAFPRIINSYLKE